MLILDAITFISGIFCHQWCKCNHQSIDGFAACEIYVKFLASAGVELPAIEGTLLPHQEIPFFVGPVPGTWAREVTASWKFSLKAEAEVKAGTKMRVDFRSGVNYYRESGWNGQLLWHIKNTPILEAKLKGTFTNEAAIEMKNSLKVGGLAGPELTLKPYIKSEATLSTEKPCQVDAALSMGMQGELKAIVQAWSYNIGEWGSTFEPFGPLVIASQTLSANATPTLKVTGAVNLNNELKSDWPSGGYYPHVCTTTGTDSIKLAMDDSQGLNKGLSKVEVSIDGNPPFLLFSLASQTFMSGYTMSPNPVQADLILTLPLKNDENMFSGYEDQFNKWYTPFRLSPGAHEFEFKVYDKCGDFSIATHAVFVTEQNEDIWTVKNTAGSETWQLGINGFEKGNFPEFARTIEPVPDGFTISPLKNGVVKHYDRDGSLLLEGSFSNNVRSGIWKAFPYAFEISNYNSVVSQVEFSEGGQPLSYLYSADYVAESTHDYRVTIQKTPSGAVQFSTISTDTSYIYQNISRSSFETGIRTIGFETATCSYDIETFVGGQRNGIATHSTFVSYESTVVSENGEYSSNLKTGKWIKKISRNLTELYSTQECSFQAGVLDGACSYTSSAESLVMSGIYSQGKRSGTWTKQGHSYSYGDYNLQAAYYSDVPDGALSVTYANGWHVSGSYVAGQPAGTLNGYWPIYGSDGKWVASYTADADPIPVFVTIPNTSSTPEADGVW